MLTLLLLCGCTGTENLLQPGMDLREKLLKRNCSFVAQVTADYGDNIYTFRVGCTAEANGDLTFIVIAPESISGITGNIRADSGFLTFDDTVLAFPLIADGEVSPVSAPWLLIKTLRSGYMAGSGKDGDYLLLTLYDSYRSDALHVDIWLDQQNLPVRGEFLWQGRRILSIDVEEFAFV